MLLLLSFALFAILVPLQPVLAEKDATSISNSTSSISNTNKSSNTINNNNAISNDNAISNNNGNSNNNNNKRAGLSLDLGNAFLQGEGLV